MDPQQQTQKPLSKAALIGLICSAVGLCFPPLALVGLILGIVGIVKTSNNPNLSGKVLAIVAVCLVPVTIFTTGIMAAIAIPNFIKFQGRSKQSECKINLKGMFTAEKSFFLEHQAYSTRFQDVDFAVERGNRYAYFMAAGPIQERSGMSDEKSPSATGVGTDTFKFAHQKAFTAADLPPVLAGGVKLGLSGKCPDCDLTMACIGDVGMHEGRDVWSISTTDRQGPRGEVISAGMPFNDAAEW
jgi:type IV pilus assembly protein PilA